MWKLVALSMVLLVLAVGAEAEPVLEDAAGDVEARLNGQTASPPQEQVRNVDLRSLSIDEDPATFTFTLGLAALESSDTAETSSQFSAIYFAHGNNTYRIGTSAAILGTPTTYFSSLAVQDPDGDGWSFVTGLEPVLDREAQTISVAVARDMIRDEQGATPFPGRSLTGIYAEASGWGIFSEGFSLFGTADVEAIGLYDEMPDDRTPAAVPIQYGIQQDGHARVRSDEPFRFSNGEATTFVYTVQAHNNHTESDTFELAATSVPTGWDVRTPTSRVTLDAGETVEVPVIVRTVFAHDHGNSASFILEMTSLFDPGSVGRVELGVHYPAVPQPAGHHDTLYVHSYDNSDTTSGQLNEALSLTLGGRNFALEPYMNTLQIDDSSDEVAIDSFLCEILIPGSGYCWDIPLYPGLLLGLDFDMAGTGTFTGTITTTVPMPETRLQGELIYLAPEDPDDEFGGFFRDEIVVATLATSDPVELGVQGSATFELTVTPTPEGDYIEYARGSSLVLELVATTLRPDNFYIGPKVDRPLLETGAALQLPLLEYEDPVQTSFVGGASSIQLNVQGGQQRLVNAGETRLFRVDVKNTGAFQDTFRVGLVGSNVEWGRVIGDDTMRLDAGELTELLIAVSAPAEASEGDRADLVLEVASMSDIEVRSLARLLTVVDDREDHPNEAEDAGLADAAAQQETPGLSMLSLFALLAVTRLWPTRRP